MDSIRWRATQTLGGRETKHETKDEMKGKSGGQAMLRQREELFAALPVSVVSHPHPKCKQFSDLTHLLPGQVPDYCPDLLPRDGHELVDLDM